MPRQSQFDLRKRWPWLVAVVLVAMAGGYVLAKPAHSAPPKTGCELACSSYTHRIRNICGGSGNQEYDEAHSQAFQEDLRKWQATPPECRCERPKITLGICDYAPTDPVH